MSEITISCLCGKTLRATSEDPRDRCDDCEMEVLIAAGVVERGPHLKLVHEDEAA